MRRMCERKPQLHAAVSIFPILREPDSGLASYSFLPLLRRCFPTNTQLRNQRWLFVVEKLSLWMKKSFGVQSFFIIIKWWKVIDVEECLLTFQSLEFRLRSMSFDFERNDEFLKFTGIFYFIDILEYFEIAVDCVFRNGSCHFNIYVS